MATTDIVARLRSIFGGFLLGAADVEEAPDALFMRSAERLSLSDFTRTTRVETLPADDLEQGVDDYGVSVWRLTASGTLIASGFQGLLGQFNQVATSSFLTTIGPADTYAETVEDGYGLIASGVTPTGTEVSATGSDLVTGKAGVFGQVSAPVYNGTVSAADSYAETVEDSYGLIATGITTSGQFVSPSLQSGAVTLDQEQADIDRVYQQPDGINRLAQWTYIPVYGESTSVGARGYPALTVTQPYSNLTFVGGVKTLVGSGTASAAPLVEDNNAEGGGTSTDHGETTCSAMANTISEYLLQHYGTDPAQVQIFTSAPGQGGQRVDQIAKGTAFYTRLLGHVGAARDLASAAGKSFICPCVALIVGANDAFAGTSRAAISSGLQQLASDMDADIRALTGQSLAVRTLIYQTSGAGAATATEQVQLGQLDAAKGSTLIQLMSPWYDLPYDDGVHAINAGYKLAGRRQGVQAARYLMEGRTRGLSAVSASARGQTIRLRFSENIVVDTDAIGSATQAGVAIVDQIGNVPVSGISVSNGVLILTIARALAGSWKARIALDYKGTGLTVGQSNYGRSSNIRAALTHTYYASGVKQTIYRWAPHQQLSGISLEF